MNFQPILHLTFSRDWANFTPYSLEWDVCSQICIIQKLIHTYIRYITILMSKLSLELLKYVFQDVLFIIRWLIRPFYLFQLLLKTFVENISDNLSNVPEHLKIAIENALNRSKDFLRNSECLPESPYTTIFHRDIWSKNIMIKRGTISINALMNDL